LSKYLSDVSERPVKKERTATGEIFVFPWNLIGQLVYLSEVLPREIEDEDFAHCSTAVVWFTSWELRYSSISASNLIPPLMKVFERKSLKEVERANLFNQALAG